MEIITTCAATQCSINSMRERHRKGLRRRKRGNKTGSDGVFQEVRRQRERDEKTELGGKTGSDSADKDLLTVTAEQTIVTAVTD